MQKPFRYLAYTSDLGEAFRPLVHLSIVRATYGVSWAYCFLDTYLKNKGPVTSCVGEERNFVGSFDPTKSLPNPDARSCSTVTWRDVSWTLGFHAVASMGLPALTINRTVWLAKKFVKGPWPTVAGLAVIPALPYMFDHPIENLIHKIRE